MKIIKLTNSFTIENKGSITQHALNTVTAYIGQLRDSVTFKDAAQNIGSAPVEEITVNGEQMKSDNIETLLEELFFLSVNKEEGTGSFVQQQVNWIEDNVENVSFIKNRPYTKAEYSDPLVFPTPIRSGHITEFYKDNVLYSSYQWNGWFWAVLGMKPNFVFRSNIVYAESDLSNYAPWFKNDSIYSLNVKNGTPASLTLNAASVIENSTDSFLILGADIALDNLCNEIERLEKIEISDSFNSAIDIHYAEGQNKETVPTKKFYLQETSSTGNTYIDLEGAAIYIDDIKTGMHTEKTPSLYASGTSVNISKSSTTQAYLKIYSSSDSELKLSDNNFTTLNLAIETKDTTTTYDTDLDLTGNSGLNEINISGTSNYKGSVLNGVFDFDETSLKSIIINAVKFSDQALEALIIALTSKTYSQSSRTFKMTPSLLTQEQTSKLTDAAWTIK